MVKRKKIFKIFNIVVLILAFLCLYGFGIAYIVKGGNRLGIFTEPIKRFISFPKTAINVLKSNELKGIPETYIKKDTSFKPINNLKYDLYGLNSFYSTSQDRWEINLFNFKNDSIIRQWILEEGSFNHGDRARQFKNSEPQNSILLDDGSLIAHLFQNQESL